VEGVVDIKKKRPPEPAGEAGVSPRAIGVRIRRRVTVAAFP
jgi:hypothetical protein